ncbi:MAG: hypothetical protein HXS53_01475 [Theionarchaea archaeon]|nr:hypothetical protein [Theionarchaea archaeon]
MNISLKRIRKKKGISPIIGMVLMTAVVFSILALFFVWRASQEEFQLQRERERIQQLKLIEGESMEFLTIPSGDLNGQFIYFYNNGSSRPDIQRVYIDDSEVTFDSVTWDSTNPRKGSLRVTESIQITESLKMETQLGNLYLYSPPAAVIDVLSIGDFGDDARLLIDGGKSNAVGGVIVRWQWNFYEGSSGTPSQTEEGARVSVNLPKETTPTTWRIELTVSDNTDLTAARTGSSEIFLTIAGSEGSGEGGDTGFGGEGAPGGIYISLGGSGGGTSIAEGRIIAFNIKNFSGRMIPLNTLRFYGIKNPSNYTCNQVYLAPIGKTLTEDDLYYSGDNIGDGGIAEFDETYYVGDRDEVHVELRASSGARPQEGHVFLIILYDSATPTSYYTVTVPIRTADYTDDVEFNPADVFHVVAGGNILQGKALDLNTRILTEIGIAFSTPAGTGEVCDDRLIEFTVAGTAYWTGSVASESTIYLGTDSNGDGVPDTGVTWDNSRTIQFKFNFTDVSQRIYYFVYRFADGTSIAHKVPRFQLALASGEPERQDVSSTTGGTVTWDLQATQVDILNTPIDLTISGLPCYCVASFAPAAPVSVPNTITLTIQVFPGAPTGLYPIVITGDNENLAYSCVVFLYLS